MVLFVSNVSCRRVEVYPRKCHKRNSKLNRKISSLAQTDLYSLPCPYVYVCMFLSMSQYMYICPICQLSERLSLFRPINLLIWSSVALWWSLGRGSSGLLDSPRLPRKSVQVVNVKERNRLNFKSNNIGSWKLCTEE